MQESVLKELIAKIQRYGCEFQAVEVKRAQYDCPKKLRDTLSSFSNQDGGGTIIFGLEETTGFSVVGVYDAQDLQKKVTAQCDEMQPAVRPLFTFTDIDGKIVASAEIPGVDYAERPVFYKGAGKYGGSYVRVGEADKLMTDDEIYSYEAFKKRIRDDKRTVDGVRKSMLDEDKVADYLSAVKRGRNNLSANTSDDEILDLMGVTSDGIPTLAGIMTLGKYPQAVFPQLDITAVVVPGTEIGETESGARFIANERINGTIPDMLESALNFVKRNMRVKTIIDENGKRNDRYEFPIKAVREVLLNALVHRDYSTHTEGIPITLRMFSDRLEVTNKGGLYGRISVDTLGKVNPDTRNPTLANMLEVLHVTENRFSGIPTIMSEMKSAGLPTPIFRSRLGEFTAILKNDMNVGAEVGTSDYTAFDERSKSLIEFCKTPRTRKEVVEFLGLSAYYVRTKILPPLIEKGAIKLSEPDNPASHKQKFYS